jgi:hypothetical protein
MNEPTTPSGAAVPCVALLECPFCGSPAKLITTSLALLGWWSGWAVRCTFCRADPFPWQDSPDDAAAIWNHRHSNVKGDRT